MLEIEMGHGKGLQRVKNKINMVKSKITLNTISGIELATYTLQPICIL